MTMLETELGTLITFNPVSATTETTLDELAGRLQQSGFHHWPVIDRQRMVVGIVSDADVARHITARRTAESAQRENGRGPHPVQPRAGDIMSPRVISIDISATRAEALAKLIEHEVHSLPVLDEGQLVGIVSSTDFLRELSQGELPGHRDPVSRHMVKTDETVDAGADLETAKSTIMASKMQYLAIAKGDCPLGVISRRMLRKAKCRQMVHDALHGTARQKPQRVHQLVKSAPTLKPGERLAKAAQLMVDFSVQGVAVINHSHRLLGLLSEDDVLQAIFNSAAGAPQAGGAVYAH